MVDSGQISACSSDLEKGLSSTIPHLATTSPSPVYTNVSYSSDLEKASITTITSESPSPPPPPPPSSRYVVDWNTPLPLELPEHILKTTDPFTWSSTKKNTTLTLACLSTFLGAWVAGAYNLGLVPMANEFTTTRLPLLVGMTNFCLGFALTPMVTAPLSEVYGRLPLFYASYTLFIGMQIATAAAPSLAALLVARFFIGVAASTFSSICGGVLADMYRTEDRGGPMAWFTAAAVFGMGAGPLASGWIGEAGGWRWIHWTQVIMNAAAGVMIVFLFPETRGSVLLERRARALNTYFGSTTTTTTTTATAAAATTATGYTYTVAVDNTVVSLQTRLKTSLTRPFVFLFTEPVVFFFSLWVAFAWAVLFLFLQAVPQVFTAVHGFSSAHCGAVFAAMCIGALLALALALSPLARGSSSSSSSSSSGNGIDPRPESRLYAACTFGGLLPVGLLLFGLTSRSDVHYLAPATGLLLATVGIFTIYLAVFNYFCDCYGMYASSAIAAQSFARNMMAAAFPLVADAMYRRLGFRGGGVMLAGVAVGLGMVPWVLVWRGEWIRARSRFAKALEG